MDQSVTPCACCFVVTADNKYIMACGYWDNSFKCFSADSGKKFTINANVHDCGFCLGGGAANASDQVVRE